MKQHRILPLLLSLCLLLSACGGEAKSEAYDLASDSSYNEVLEMPGETIAAVSNPEELKTDSSLSGSPALNNRKLIKTVSIDAETEHYDDLLTALDGKIASLGGYVETRETGSRSRDRRWSRMTIRIPAENLGDFVIHVTEQANVLSTSEQTQDVTLQYTDTEAKITALETEQTRLLELLAGANNLSEILEIEARLSDVTYELERYESRKRGYDNQITYATVTLYVQQVQTLTPVEEPTILSRISTGFRSSLEGVCDGIVDIFVYLIAGSPYIVVCGTILGLILAIARKQSRKGQKNRQSPPSENP